MRLFMDRIFLKAAVGLLPIALLLPASSASLAASYKLYINKQQSASNVIIFEDSMSATVTHTNEGMELTLPGVEVALRCKSTDSNNTTDTCVIAIEQATTSGGTTTTSGGTTTTSGGTTTTSGGTTTTSGGTDSGDCVVTTWNNCSDSSSSGTTTTSGGSTSGGTTTTSGGSTSGGTTTTSGGGSGSCSPTGSLTCGSLDYGPGGTDATGKTSRIILEPGVTLALPFTVTQGANYGQIGIVPTSLGLPDDGSAVRMWWSSEAGGKPLANNWCARNLGFEGGSFWDQSGKLGYGCPIPNVNAKYFVNLRLCISSYSDGSCSAPGVTDATQSTYIYIQGNEA